LINKAIVKAKMIMKMLVFRLIDELGVVAGTGGGDVGTVGVDGVVGFVL
jgi:hypothetical protein